MNQDEWHGRYLQQLVDRGGLSCREAYDTLIAGMGEHDYEDSPENDADEEMSCWTDDG